MSFNPLTSIVFTIDFFLLSINIYCLLCVVSQYQEYRAGRGTAQYEAFTGRLPVIRYEAPQGPTSFLSSKKAAPSAIISSVSRPPPILLTTSPEGRAGMTSPAAVAAEAAIAADIEARGAKATVSGEGANPGEGRITFIGVPGVEGLTLDEGKRWEERKRRRPQKRVQFPLDESCLEAPALAVARAEEGLAEAEIGNGHHEGPFISEGGHRSVADSVTKSAMLFLSSSSVTAAAAVVVANDTAPLLSPKPPLSVDCSTGTAFFGGGMVDS
ncbi:uncharacterized protein LOC124158685 [Ischnura elegans]|uniref:uncharacterized protein LOC124158685 n=1 Tax=Ischnura elegans TaxID=197161 RepID=UPI001ED89755|nr:uncharacterized protein LOC124158685 [Ischnura elegans]